MVSHLQANALGYMTLLTNVLVATIVTFGGLFVRMKLQYLKKTTDAVKRTADDVHDLVNSSTEVQLRLNLMMARRIAGMTEGTPLHPDDVTAVRLAERTLFEHQKSQAKVDERAVNFPLPTP